MHQIIKGNLLDYSGSIVGSFQKKIFNLDENNENIQNENLPENQDNISKQNNQQDIQYFEYVKGQQIDIKINTLFILKNVTVIYLGEEQFLNISENNIEAKQGIIRNLGEGQIEDEIQAFSTQKFPIRYAEQSVPLNVMCYWKTDVDAYPDYNKTPFYLVCELMCADFSSMGQPSNNSEQSAFKQVSMFQCRINNSAQGIHEYLPIQFDQNHYCQAEATFHTLLLVLLSFLINNLRMQQIQNKYILEKQKILVKEDIVNDYYNYYVIGLRNGYYTLKKVIDQILQQYPELLQYSASLNDQIEITVQEVFLSKSYNNFGINSQSQNSINNSQQQMNEIKVSQRFNLKNYKDIEKFTNCVLLEMNKVSGCLFQLWNQMIEILRIDGGRTVNMMKVQYIQRMKEKWGENVVRDQFYHDITQQKVKMTGKQHEGTSAKLRQALEFQIQNSEPLNLEDMHIIPKANQRPFLLEEIYINPNKVKNQFQYNQKMIQQKIYNKVKNIKKHIHAIKDNPLKVHLIVLCHGFQGNYFDTRLVKNNLSILFPEFVFLSSKSNEEFTDGNIADMGKRLANEVILFVNENTLNDTLGKLSFIGHSLGGIIIRAALPFLSQYSDKMHLYMSLSSPHLGYMYNSSKLIDAGIWFLITTRKCECLKQLNMSDCEQLADTFLYKLTNQPGLNWFKNIALLSSYQDQYVPFESARIQKCDEASDSNAKGRLYNSMVDNLLSSLRTDRIHRIDVNFKIKDQSNIKKTIDNVIGRSAHIQFLENDPLAKTLVYCFDHLFK
ncbi:serine esterase, putative [Ichthyophthirius multifiliis]|uniref:Serine esterase, putative n=1 Tax=Ichthyophthirius multifiliis TaxID=5932 RepID=G0QY96_ICHMU|nr:serine esterase, putative [Ichthyophthirius multifiliis]EGR29800.1 serine esterase, putative [Ichthyophthirius multifiliis]|eukprot:XP_004031036.1 serine esterase, putative [Ichthyophthirius multifiliis]